MNSKKPVQIIIVVVLISIVSLHPASAFSTKQALGNASEGFMKDYFETGGWKQLEGQSDKTHGIDGLFVKYDQNGNIRDVLVAESKYNKSQLGRNLVCGDRQMSNEWIQCKLDDLIKNSSDRQKAKEYEQIKTHVQHNNYRLRKVNVVNKNKQCSPNSYIASLILELEAMEGRHKRSVATIRSWALS